MDSEQAGVSEAYRAPAADDDIAAVGAEVGSGYIVSPTKLVVLYLATFGLYGVYWFYKHWKYQQLQHRSAVWPVARAIFSIFFVTQLFKAIDLEARVKGLAPSWNPGANAAMFIVLTIAGRILDKLGGKTGFGPVDMISLLVPLAAVVPLVAAQGVANLRSGDEGGRSNRSMNAGNIVAIVLGVAFWALMGAALLLPETP